MHTLNALIPTECEYYPSVSILKHANDFDKLNKSRNVNLLIMTPYKKCKLLKSVYIE